MSVVIADGVTSAVGLLRKVMKALGIVKQAQAFLLGVGSGVALYVIIQRGPSGIFKAVVGGVLSTARSLPGISSVLQAAESSALQSIVDELAPPDPTARTEMWAVPAPADAIFAEIAAGMRRDVAASGFDAGKAFAGIYHHPLGELTTLQSRVLSECLNTNLLYPGVFKSCRKMEAEVVAIMVNLLKGKVGLDDDDAAASSAAPAALAGAGGAGAADPAPGACGMLTTGGTESIMLAVKAYRDAAYEARGGPFAGEAVACTTCHPALDKACEYLGITLHKLPADAETQALPVAAVAAALNRNTLFVYASAPSFPHGVVDPIPALAAITASRGVGLHVDNCFGGVLLSYLHAAQRRGTPQAAGAAPVGAQGHAAGAGAGAASSPFPVAVAVAAAAAAAAVWGVCPLAPIPDFDFRVAGVTSMSADVHKYGFAPKGASVVAFRTPELRRHAYTTVTDWPGGLYATPTVTGSRSGAPAAVAWATLKAMGGASYARTAAEVHSLTSRFASAVQAIPQLRLVGRPSACVVAFTVAPGAPFGIYALAARMEARGHHMNSLQDPPAAAFVVTERAETSADDWVASLQACVAEAVANPRDPRFEGKGSAGIYGASAVLPPNEVGRILQRYCDVLYMVRPGGK